MRLHRAVAGKVGSDSIRPLLQILAGGDSRLEKWKVAAELVSSQACLEQLKGNETLHRWENYAQKRMKKEVGLERWLNS